jgi:hypothetical protein
MPDAMEMILQAALALGISGGVSLYFLDEQSQTNLVIIACYLHFTHK